MNKAKRYIIRVVAAVLGLIIGAFLYFVYIFGGTYVPIPIVSEDEYETIALSNDGSLYCTIWHQVSPDCLFSV